MGSQRVLYSLGIILVTEIILIPRVHGHSDCNHDVVMKNIFYMCSSYNPSSIKRETNGVPPNFPNGYVTPNGDIASQPFLQQPQQQQYSDFRGISPVQQPTFPSASQYPWQVAPNNNVGNAASQQEEVQDHRSRKKGMQPPAVLPNEPEDFASFNNWYLNPVYADAEWQSAIERWRRKSHITEEIWRFVQNKCCRTGCPFPDEYLQLEKRVNICGMGMG